MFAFLAWILVVVILYKQQVVWWIWALFGVGTIVMLLSML